MKNHPDKKFAGWWICEMFDGKSLLFDHTIVARVTTPHGPAGVVGIPGFDAEHTAC